MHGVIKGSRTYCTALGVHRGPVRVCKVDQKVFRAFMESRRKCWRTPGHDVLDTCEVIVLVLF